MPKLSSLPKTATKGVVKVAGGALDEVQQIVDTTERQIERKVAPIRQSILKRFPILFLLAVTFGITATLTGMEQLLIQTEILQNSPGVVLFIGVSILILTGTLYKKLG